MATDIRVRLRELCHGISQATFLRLEPRPRAVRNQGNDTRRRAILLKPPRAVDRMETRVRNGLAIADVMKPGGHHDSVGDVEAVLL
jgi:hypothetical protein